MSVNYNIQKFQYEIHFKSDTFVENLNTREYPIKASVQIPAQILDTQGILKLNYVDNALDNVLLIKESDEEEVFIWSRKSEEQTITSSLKIINQP